MPDQNLSSEMGEKKEVNTQVVDTETKEQDSWKNGEKFDAEKAQALIEKLREEARGKKALEKKAQEYEAAEQKRKEAEMSELEKLQSQLKQREDELNQAKRREMQRTAAEKFKLPGEMASRLIGETLEEFEADAEKLAALIPKSTIQPKGSPTNPGNAHVEETREQKRERLLGKASDIFASGGGINYPPQE